MPQFTTLVLTTAALAAAQTTLIPTDCFSSQSDFDTYFSYDYPWNSDVHNGGARMSSTQCSLSNGALVETATYDPDQTDLDDLAINYLSCAVYAKQTFAVTAGGGPDFQADFLAPVDVGTWPAFWLTATVGWPPEIDMAEWKGSGDISFNTFNSSEEVTALDREYVDPGEWHTVLAELRDHRNGDVMIKFFLDGVEQTTQYGYEYLDKEFWFIINLQMEGSSGSPGPDGDTTYSIRNLEVTSYNV